MIRILIAEPDEGLRILLTEELVEEGYDVISTHPESLWDRLEEERPQLVLLGLARRNRLRVRGLQAEGLPVLIYGRSPLYPEGDEDSKRNGAVTAEFDLKQIKAKIPEVLEGLRSPERPLSGVSNRMHRSLPQDQIQFDFSGGNGR